MSVEEIVLVSGTKRTDRLVKVDKLGIKASS